MGWQLLLGSLPLALLALVTEDIGSIDWSVSFVLALTTLSVLGTAAAFWLWFSLLQLASLNQLNVFTFLTPIFGLIIGAVFFAEQIRILEITGVSLSILGIYWVTRPLKLNAGIVELSSGAPKRSN